VVLLFIKQDIRKEENMTIYRVYKRNHPVTPKDVINVFDLGYLGGVEKDFPEQLSPIPNRKQRNRELLQEEKEYNKSHSKKRIVIEHTICKLKKYKILADVFYDWY
jgi:hypothetical protein